MTTKEYEEIWGDDGTIPYLDCGGCYMTMSFVKTQRTVHVKG